MRSQITRAQFLEYLLFDDGAADARAVLPMTQINEMSNEYVGLWRFDGNVRRSFEQRHEVREHGYFQVPGEDDEAPAADTTYFKLPGGDNA